MEYKIFDKLDIKIFADGANKREMTEMASQSFIKGLTTNPTLMRKAGVQNYETFARSVLEEIKEKPISFEVFSDDFDEMISQGLKISSWADNVYVKIPVTNTEGELSGKVIKTLSDEGVKVNVTALTTPRQVEQVSQHLNENVASYISIFAGRIADTGVDPIPTIVRAKEILKNHQKSEIIWASPREVLNVFQALEAGCHIITATTDILNKLTLYKKNLDDYSLETVLMFRADALAAGYTI